MLVFVYGSLRKGHHNHSYISENLVQSLGVYKTRETFYMLHKKGHSFPYILSPSLLKIHEKPVHITGEVYEITEKGIAVLDSFAGVTQSYSRDLLYVENSSCDSILCFTYVLNDMTAIQNILSSEVSLISSGDWCADNHSKHHH